MIAEGRYGPVHFAHGSYLQDWMLYDTDWNWRADPRENGPSRAIADIGSHWVDLVARQRSDRRRGVRGPRDAAPGPPSAAGGDEHVRASHRWGVRAGPDRQRGLRVRPRPFRERCARRLCCVAGERRRRNRLSFEIDTAEAAFAWDQEHPDTAWIGQRRAPSLEYPRDAALDVPLSRLPAGHPEGWRETLYNLFDDFYAAVRAARAGAAHEPRFATFADGHHTTLLVEAVLRSHQTGSWVSVAEG